MASREFTVVVESDEDGYFVGSVPELRGCWTQGKSLDELLERMREAIALTLEDEEEDDYPTKFLGVYRVAV